MPSGEQGPYRPARQPSRGPPSGKALRRWRRHWPQWAPTLPFGTQVGTDFCASGLAAWSEMPPLRGRLAVNGCASRVAIGESASDANTVRSSARRSGVIAPPLVMSGTVTSSVASVHTGISDLLVGGHGRSPLRWIHTLGSAPTHVATLSTHSRRWSSTCRRNRLKVRPHGHGRVYESLLTETLFQQLTARRRSAPRVRHR